MIKCVITGFSGFLAQNLEEACKKAEIMALGLPRETLYDMKALVEFFDINKPDFVVHTAAYGNKFQQTNDLETIYANIVATINLLEMTRDLPYKGFVNISSSSAGLPYDTFYSATKASGERLVRAFVNKYNKPVFSVRPFTIIGKGEQDEHLIPTLIRSCRDGVEMPFVKESVHDYIDVSDVCDAILCLMQYSDKLQGQVIDIGTGKGTPNKKIKDMVEKIMGKKANVKIVESLRPYDSTQWVANPAVLKYLGWVPSKTLELTIEEMVNT